MHPLQLAQPHTLTVWLHLTERCNLRCLYCYLPPSGESMATQIGLKAVEAAFEGAAQGGFDKVKLKYAGGEPTLNFERVIEICHAAEVQAKRTGIGLESVLLSNGLALTGPMISFLRQHQIELMISLDGLEQYQDAQRQRPGGRPSFAQVLATLDRLDQQQLRPQISVTVSHKNLAGLPELVRFLLARDYPFHFNFFRENPYAREEQTMRAPDEALIASLREVYAVIEAHLPAQSLLGALLDRVRLDIPHDRPCGACQSYLVVRANGGIAPCQMMEGTTGNLESDHLLQSIRAGQTSLFNLPVYQRGSCVGCFWQFACAGGCPMLTLQTFGRYDTHSPYCQVYQSLIPDVLRLEGLRLLHQELAGGHIRR